MADKTGFLVNPIAGMGGRVGLKGTDAVVGKAIELGAKPVAQRRAECMLVALVRILAIDKTNVAWLTCDGQMGADLLRQTGFENVSVVYTPKADTDQNDTRNAVRAMCEQGATLIVFCGGDGTARDVVEITGRTTPILGIPSGVKMYSGVFASSPERSAEVLAGYLGGRLSLADADILDLDEGEYRKGNWRVRLCDTAKVPAEPVYVQASKSLIDTASEADMKLDLAEVVANQIREDTETLYFLGPGSTVGAVGKALGVSKTLLGIDAVKSNDLLAADLNESEILQQLDKHHSSKLVLSPIGAQGFVLGRGNLQISPDVVRRIGKENLIVVATPGKLSQTSILRFDTGDDSLDRELAAQGFISVWIGPGQRRLVRVVV